MLFVPIEILLADILTNSIEKHPFEVLIRKLGIFDFKKKKWGKVWKN